MFRHEESSTISCLLVLPTPLGNLLPHRGPAAGGGEQRLQRRGGEERRLLAEQQHVQSFEEDELPSYKEELRRAR